MRPYALASIAFGACCLCLACGLVRAQNSPLPAPSGPVNPPVPVVAPPVPGSLATATPANAPADASPLPSGTPVEVPPAVPTPSPTPVPIFVSPPLVGVSPGSSAIARVTGVFGTLTARIADPTMATVGSIDQTSRTVTLQGLAPGMTTLTVSDDRGQTRDVPVRVAFLAGSVAEDTNLRVTGNPASTAFIKSAATVAAARAARLRPGASVAVSTDAVQGAHDLSVSNVTTVTVPLQLNGTDYFSNVGTTRVHVENVALPRIRPQQLLVSDYPERLTENGVLFTADIDRTSAQRFLYYHYNPQGQPGRRILLKVQNPSNAPATLQFISGEAGPSNNEMEVGHLSTSRFLIREAQNEGTVITIPAGATINLVDQLLPPQTIVSNLLQLREIDGNPVKLTLVAQDATDPLDKPIDSTELLQSDVKHARGVYRVPEFFFDYTYTTDGPDLEIPIGQLPLPNLREGQALGGDYGVLQSVSVTIVNPTPSVAQVALYENPRGGRATGTFIIDRTLVRSHAVAAFSKWKLREYKVPPHSIFRISVTTMPEGGSSYPVRLILAPDDGSASPGSSSSPTY